MNNSTGEIMGTGLTEKGNYALSVSEQTELTALETDIENKLQAFYDVGSALLRIRDSRLYRKDYATFDEYCRGRWEMDKRYANYLISASQVIDNLGTIVPENQLPTTESQTRELTTLEPEAQRIVWQVVEQTAPAGKVTAAHVKSVVNVFKEVMTTGAIDDGTGEQIAISEVITAVITEETYERLKRQQTYISERQGEPPKKLVDSRVVLGRIAPGPRITLEITEQGAMNLMPFVDDGKPVRVVIYETKETVTANKPPVENWQTEEMETATP